MAHPKHLYLHLSTPFCCWTCSSRTSLLAAPEIHQYPPMSGPLHLLCPLPATLFHIVLWLVLSLPGCFCSGALLRHRTLGSGSVMLCCNNKPPPLSMSGHNEGSCLTHATHPVSSPGGSDGHSEARLTEAPSLPVFSWSQWWWQREGMWRITQ